MGVWEQSLLPRVIDWGMDTRAMRFERRRALSEVRGRVLELGFGSGLNLPHYSAEVSALTAVEPSSRAVELAAARIAASPFPVEVIGLEGERLPCPDESFETVVSTFTLCTIKDVARALMQVRRVLTPGGRFFFLEHGRSPDVGVHRVQRWAEPVQKTLFGGCHLTRPIVDLIAAAGFEVERVDRYYGRGPKPMVYFSRGVARRPSGRQEPASLHR